MLPMRPGASWYSIASYVIVGLCALRRLFIPKSLGNNADNLTWGSHWRQPNISMLDSQSVPYRIDFVKCFGSEAVVLAVWLTIALALHFTTNQHINRFNYQIVQLTSRNRINNLVYCCISCSSATNRWSEMSGGPTRPRTIKWWTFLCWVASLQPLRAIAIGRVAILSD